jgi:hypothetical protein
MRMTTRRTVGRLTSVKPGGGKDAAAADVELTPGDVLARLGEHRIALQGARTPVSGEVDGGACERVADAPAVEASILNLWHWHLGGSPRVPKTVWMASQLASLAGTIVTSAVVAAPLMGTP